MEPVHQKLDQLFGQLAGKPTARNALMAIDAPGRDLVWRGHAEHLSATAGFCIASCTKLYTAALAIQLVEAGTFSLDDPAHKLLPDGMMDGLAIIGGQDRSHAITVRHLLSNTSGLADYFEDRLKGGRSVFEDILAGKDQGWTSAEALARTRQLRPRFVPGLKGKAHYSDTNFVLLGEIIEHATGQRFDQLVADRIVAKAGLSATWVHGPGTAVRYGSIVPISNGPVPLHIPRTMMSLGSQGGVISTLDDCMIFLKAFMGGVLFDTRWIEKMKAEWNPVFFPFRYGLGMMKFDVHPVFTLFRRVPPLYGHSGSSGVLMYHCPERDIWVCGSVNQVGARGLPYQFMLRAIMALG